LFIPRQRLSEIVRFARKTFSDIPTLFISPEKLF
jgi:hypothetical protein